MFGESSGVGVVVGRRDGSSTILGVMGGGRGAGRGIEVFEKFNKPELIIESVVHFD